MNVLIGIVFLTLGVIAELWIFKNRRSVDKYILLDAVFIVVPFLIAPGLYLILEGLR